MARYLLIVMLALSSCAPVYVPNLRNSPMFTKGGEVQASAQIGNGIEAQTAVAVTDHFGVIGNFSYIDETEENTSHFLRHRFLEGGIGYFLNRDDSFFEIFVGYGKGTGTTYEEYEFLSSSPTEIAATGRYERFFVQPAVGVNKSEFQFSFVPRVSVIDFYEFSTELVSTKIDEDPRLLFEPAIVGRYNFANNHMFFTFQAGVSLGMSEDIYFDRRTLQMGAGLGFRVGGTKALVSRL